MIISNKRKQNQALTTISNNKGGFYFHTEEDYKLKRESEIKIIYRDGIVEVPKCN